MGKNRIIIDRNDIEGKFSKLAFEIVLKKLRLKISICSNILDLYNLNISVKREGKVMK